MAWREWSREEEKQLERIGSLDEVKEAVKESIRDEMSELTMIKDNCSTDTLTISKCCSVWCVVVSVCVYQKLR